MHGLRLRDLAVYGDRGRGKMSLRVFYALLVSSALACGSFGEALPDASNAKPDISAVVSDPDSATDIDSSPDASSSLDADAAICLSVPSYADVSPWCHMLDGKACNAVTRINAAAYGESCPECDFAFCAPTGSGAQASGKCRKTSGTIANQDWFCCAP